MVRTIAATSTAVRLVKVSVHNVIYQQPSSIRIMIHLILIIILTLLIVILTYIRKTIIKRRELRMKEVTWPSIHRIPIIMMRYHSNCPSARVPRVWPRYQRAGVRYPTISRQTPVWPKPQPIHGSSDRRRVLSHRTTVIQTGLRRQPPSGSHILSSG